MSARAEAAATVSITGPSILLGSGAHFDVMHPELSAFTTEDIAYGLAYTARFRGQCYSKTLRRRVFYSVAEHSVRMSRIVPAHLARAALFHDAAEAFAPAGDMPSPYRSVCPDTCTHERRVEAAVFSRYAIGRDELRAIKPFDLVMLATERRDLMNWNGERWPVLDGVEPLAASIYPWTVENAASAFLQRIAEIQAEGTTQGSA